MQALERLGGVAGARTLLRLTSRRRVRRAVRDGRIHRLARGRFALPSTEDTRARAHELHAVLGLRSAAAAHGWELKEQPACPELIVPRGRNVAPDRRTGVVLHWTTLAPDQVSEGVTTPLRTIVDCARHLPFDEALAIADSSLRHGSSTREELDAFDVRGAGAAAVRRVLRHADGRAANPFESVLRALCIEAGLGVETQLAVDLGTGVVHTDLGSVELRLALEADSWTFHSTRQAHTRDCARYNLLTLRGWRVLRFTWEQVMHDQAYVRWVLAELVRSVERPDVVAPLPATA